MSIELYMVTDVLRLLDARGCAAGCVAVCCSVLQGFAACCSVLRCVAVCCSMLQCVAVGVDLQVTCRQGHTW